MMLAAWWCRTASTYCRWASKLTYSAPAPIATSSHAAALISTVPGARPAPASRRTVVTCRVPVRLAGAGDLEQAGPVRRRVVPGACSVRRAQHGERAAGVVGGGHVPASSSASACSSASAPGRCR